MYIDGWLEDSWCAASSDSNDGELEAPQQSSLLHIDPAYPTITENQVQIDPTYATLTENHVQADVIADVYEIIEESPPLTELTDS